MTGRGIVMEKDKSDMNNQCFVIMPISDPKEYESGHFGCVYEDIFSPAIEAAGFTPKRADDDKSSSMIQVSIIKDIIESPMAICDLSTRNPNVLFELGIRQAFDLPVVLVQEVDTPRIFDISTINTIDYRKTLRYREVLEDREKIKSAIIETKDNTKGVNSIIRLLGIESAKRKEDIDENALLYTISNQFQSIMNRLENIDRYDNTKKINFVENDISLMQKWDGRFKRIESMYSAVNTSEEARLLIGEIEDLYFDYLKHPDVSSDYKSKRIGILNEMCEKLQNMYGV